MDGGGPVPIANFRTKLEAEAAAGLLAHEGIPYLIQSQEGMAHGPMSPGATLYVARAHEELAREALGEIESLDEEDADL